MQWRGILQTNTIPNNSTPILEDVTINYQFDNSSIRAEFGSGILAAEFRPWYNNQNDVWPVNQTNSVGLFNITNDGNVDVYNVSIALNGTQTGWSAECANSTLFSPHIDVNTTYQIIRSNLLVDNNFSIWCRVDVDNPTAAWNGKFLFDWKNIRGV